MKQAIEAKSTTIRIGDVTIEAHEVVFLDPIMINITNVEVLDMREYWATCEATLGPFVRVELLEDTDE